MIGSGNSIWWQSFSETIGRSSVTFCSFLNEQYDKDMSMRSDWFTVKDFYLLPKSYFNLNENFIFAIFPFSFYTFSLEITIYWFETVI